MHKPQLGAPRMLVQLDDCHIQNNMLYGLDDLCKKYINKRMSVLELGSHRGVSTSLFCYYAGYVVAVDRNEHIALNELCQSVPNLLFRQGDFSYIIQALKNIKRTFDVIYIDGDHDYHSVKRDIEESEPLLKKKRIHEWT